MVVPLSRVAGLSGGLLMSSEVNQEAVRQSSSRSSQSAEKSRHLCYRTPSTGHSSFKRDDRELRDRSASERPPPIHATGARSGATLVRIVEIARRCVFARFMEAAAPKKFLTRPHCIRVDDAAIWAFWPRTKRSHRRRITVAARIRPLSSAST